MSEKTTGVQIDDFDRAILRILQVDNGTPQRVIAERVGLSAPAVQQCYFVNGGVTFIMTLSAASLSHFDSLLRRLYMDNEDVATYRTFIVLNRIKVGLAVPI